MSEHQNRGMRITNTSLREHLLLPSPRARRPHNLASISQNLLPGTSPDLLKLMSTRLFQVKRSYCSE